MTIDEFNKLPIDDKYSIILDCPGILKDRLIAYYRDSDWTVSLWNCDSFFAEIHYSIQQKRVLKFEGIDLVEDRINIYLDYFLQHRRSEEYYLVEIA
jgi:hypothetical protein